MKKILILFGFVATMIACTGNSKTTTEEVANDSIEVVANDSIEVAVDSTEVAVDTLVVE